VRPGEPLHAAIQRWSCRLPPRSALRIAAWLVSRKVLVVG